jgi:hypothetical protein
MMSTGGPMLSMSHLQSDAEWTNERVGMARRSTFTARGRAVAHPHDVVERRLRRLVPLREQARPSARLDD